MDKWIQLNNLNCTDYAPPRPV